MSDRAVPPLLREGADLPDVLRDALETAARDELPERARMNRIQGKLAAAIARNRDERAQVPSARISGWRSAPPRGHIRFASAKIGLAALVGMGAAWSSVEGYRVYQEASERAASERRIETPPIEPRVNLARPVSTPSPREAPSLEDSPAVVADSDPVRTAPSAVARSEASPRISKPSAVPRSAPPSAPPSVATAAPAPLEEDLLERATLALRRDPAEALALADEHAHAFGGGRLAQEREVVAIQALAKLGRSDAAGARAKRFLEQYPYSPYANDVLRHAMTGGAR